MDETGRTLISFTKRGNCCAVTGKSSHGPDDSEDKENNTKEIEPKMSHSEGLIAVESTFEQHDAPTMDILLISRLI